MCALYIYIYEDDHFLTSQSCDNLSHTKNIKKNKELTKQRPTGFQKCYAQSLMHALANPVYSFHVNLTIWTDRILPHQLYQQLFIAFLTNQATNTWPNILN
jgi:hypothetical protein